MEERRLINEQYAKRPKKAQQPSIVETLNRSCTYSKESFKRQKIEEALIHMIAKDMQPPSIVEDEGFRGFVKTLDPRYEIPSRRTIMRRILPDKYEDAKIKVQQKLDEASHVALTTDIWTSCQTQAYCCVTGHFISSSWTLESVVLETFEFNEDHTADHIAAQLKRVANAWSIETKIVCVVSDNASNMVAGVGRTGWRHLPCFAHTLNLIVQDVIRASSELGDLQMKCKAIVAHFHRSVKSSEKLKEVQRQLSLPESKLVQEVPTRWNSTYLMLQRLYEQFDAITTALCLLGYSDLCLPAEKKEEIKEILAILQPFLEATENISGDEYVSVSMIIPLTKQLQQQYQSRPTNTIARTLSVELQRRFASIETKYATAVTTLLDPRFKKLPFSDRSFLDQTTLTRMTSELSSLLSAQPPDASNIPGSSNEVDEPRETSSSLWASFDKKVADSTSLRSVTTDSMIESRRYFEEANIDRRINPLDWWKENEVRFPTMKFLARKYLCIPGSSVPSERLFSKAGQLVSERRNRIKPKNINMMLFLNKNHC